MPYIGVILDNMRATLVDRGGQYSDFADNSRLMVDTLAINGFQMPPDMPHYASAAEIYIQGKFSRIHSGSPTHRDSWLDIIGYATIALACIDRDADTLSTPMADAHPQEEVKTYRCHMCLVRVATTDVPCPNSRCPLK